MTKQQDEQFSALIDDELDIADREQLLDKISGDPESKKRWHRYHLIRDTLHSNLPDAVDPEFSSAVMSAIADEPSIFAPHTKQSIKQPSKHKALSPVAKQVAGMAIAATVAAVAVLSVQGNFQPEPGPQLATMPSSDEFVRIVKQNPTIADMNSNVVADVRTASGKPAMTVSSTSQSISIAKPASQSERQLQQQLYQYIVNHNQRVSGGEFQGIMPYARIVVSPDASHLPGIANRSRAQQ